MCAPYSTLASYTYRAKLTPGAQKKGKAGKQAHLAWTDLTARQKQNRQRIQTTAPSRRTRARDCHIPPQCTFGKQALGMFAAAARSERHRELLRAVVDDDVIRVTTLPLGHTPTRPLNHTLTQTHTHVIRVMLPNG